ncbi:uncharacterized protein LOC127835886 [Dreissena polymorpha]|uniref:uncharacterized protein LOC127835886 n=1 Tax=Dreissena polymorpha TaxID=45954 RepID=UPI0022656DDD|nr:uncharacterized protein LOC127835886 [Dreissena polymorpha]
MDLATGTSCFKNRQERASLKDDDGSVSRNEPSSCTENNSSSSSPGSKMSTNSQSTEIKNELILKMSHPVLVKTSPSSIPGSKISIKGQSVRDNDDDDEEAGIEPSSSNCRNGLSYKHILFQKQTRKGKLKDKAGNEGDGDEEACSEPLSSNALLEKRTHLHAHLVTSTEKKGHVRGKAFIVLNDQLSLDCCGDLFVTTTNLHKVYILVNTSLCMFCVSSACVCVPCTSQCLFSKLYITSLNCTLTAITKCCGFEPF